MMMVLPTHFNRRELETIYDSLLFTVKCLEQDREGLELYCRSKIVLQKFEHLLRDGQ